MQQEKLQHLLAYLDESVCEQEQPKCSPDVSPEILRGVSTLALVEDLGTARHVLLAAPALVVHDTSARHVDDAPSSISNPPAPVELLRVHEELLIEAADAIHDLSSGQQTRADQPLDVLNLVISTVTDVIPRQNRAARPPLLDSSALDHGGERRREPP